MTDPVRRRRDSRQDSFFVRFAREFGWRAYAIPVLIVLTVWVVVDVVSGDDAASDSVAQPGAVSGSGRGWGQSPDPSRGGARDVVFPAGELPAGAPYTQQGEGSFHVVGAPGDVVGQGQEQTFRYVIEVEDGLDASSYGGEDALAAMIDATLSNPKGWTADKRFAFQHVSGDGLDPNGANFNGQGEQPDLRIQLASTETTHEHCGNDLEMETSCFTPIGNRVIINEARWIRGATTFQGDLGAYRQYLINHEVGHGIGYANHEPCGAQGALAPIMMQQTLSLNNAELRKISPSESYPDNDFVCRPNAWPFP
ncbi:DUF3152 domain-containing protein [Corynebacterium argentoratense]|uniref:DUF3152 domain-containing protein n=1 Tax=Corynebacterium argentoratense TaxID=42817 RepID=UPI0028D6383D|nr:DUF3152 domain-containing protein [Corynebacterium argentoratense]